MYDTLNMIMTSLVESPKDVSKIRCRPSYSMKLRLLFIHNAIIVSVVETNMKIPLMR